jgi:hypothetical protein
MKKVFRFLWTGGLAVSLQVWLGCGGDVDDAGGLNSGSAGVSGAGASTGAGGAGADGGVAGANNAAGGQSDANSDHPWVADGDSIEAYPADGVTCYPAECTPGEQEVKCSCVWHCSDNSAYAFQCKNTMGTFKCVCLVDAKEITSCLYPGPPGTSQDACDLGSACCGSFP